MASAPWLTDSSVMFTRNVKSDRVWLAVVFFLVCQLIPALAENPKIAPHWLKANHLMGMTVEDIDGERIGRLQNIALDMSSGRVRYVILAPDGILAGRTRLRAVPPELVSAATAKRDVIGFALTREQWDRAPTFNSFKIATLGNAKQDQEIYQFYRNLKAEFRATSEDTDSTNATEHLTRTSRRIEVKLANEIIGKSIVDRDREKIGEVLDLLVAFDPASPVLAVFSAGRIGRNQEDHYVVPLRNLALQKGRLVLDGNRKLLDAARPLDGEAWKIPTVSDSPQVFRYALND